MTEETCQTCRWWLLSGYSVANPEYGLRGAHGPGCDGTVSTCHRNAPIADLSRQDRFMGDAVFPMTKADDFCGEYKPRST